MDFQSIVLQINNSFVYRYSKRPRFLKRPFILKYNHQKFKIPLKDGFGERNASLKEGWFCKLIQSIKLPEESHFLDIGVNEGQSLITFRSCYPNITYWGFEPNPNSIAYVNALIKANNFQKTFIIPVGLSSKNSLVKLYIKNESDSTATISKEMRTGFYTSEQVQYVPVFSFDELDLDIPTISLIKIDVEGAELDVIKGMLNTIQKHQPIITCEVLDYHSEESKTYSQQRVNQLMDLFRQMDYRAYRVHFDKDSIQYEEVAHIDLTQWTPQSLHLNDYIFTPATVTELL